MHHTARHTKTKIQTRPTHGALLTIYGNVHDCNECLRSPRHLHKQHCTTARSPVPESYAGRRRACITRLMCGIRLLLLHCLALDAWAHVPRLLFFLRMVFLARPASCLVCACLPSCLASIPLFNLPSSFRALSLRQAV